MNTAIPPADLVEMKRLRGTASTLAGAALTDMLWRHSAALLAAYEELEAQKQLTRSVFKSAVDVERELKQTLADVRSDAEKRIAELEAGLKSMAEMPEHDQDDAHRLRHMAKQALKGGAK